MTRRVVKLLFLLPLVPPALADPVDLERWQHQATRVSIIRDQWGIAHVYGKSDATASEPEEDGLTVDWGSSRAAVYVLNADGTLSGLWNEGEGEETLTPAR